MKKNLNIAYLNGAEGVTRKSSTSNGGSNVSLMKEVTYAELKELRDGGKLVAGQMYRMIDYETTTGQEGTQAAGHPFDLILTALDEKTLDEKCSAIHSARDTEGYFANSDLAAWDVRYCLDNDILKYSWATFGGTILTFTFNGLSAFGVLNGTTEFEGKTYVKWDVNDTTGTWYVLSETKEVGIGQELTAYHPTYNQTIVVIAQSIEEKIEGKGVIYRMIDESRNDIPYDFKNIMFTRKIASNGKLDTEGGTDTFVYTFNYYENDVCKDYSNINPSMCSENYMAYFNSLPNNVFLLTMFYRCMYNTFGNKCYNNTFGEDCYRNTFGDECYNNTFSDGCDNNIFDGECYNNTFGPNCTDNTFGGSCYNNIFTYACSQNTFGWGCRNNTFGDACSHNTFGGLCDRNIFERFCERNIFGRRCDNNTFRNYCNNNTFGYKCNNNTFDASYSQNIELKNNINYIKILASGSGSDTDYAQNCEIKGISGTSSSPVEITLTRNNEFTTYISKSSNGDIIQYTDEDIYNAINK